LALGWAIGGEILAPRVVFGGLIVLAAIAWMSRVTSGETRVSKIREHAGNESRLKQAST